MNALLRETSNWAHNGTLEPALMIAGYPEAIGVVRTWRPEPRSRRPSTAGSLSG